jgi:hypothetical protein
VNALLQMLLPAGAGVSKRLRHLFGGSITMHSARDARGQGEGAPAVWAGRVSTADAAQMRVSGVAAAARVPVWAAAGRSADAIGTGNAAGHRRDGEGWAGGRPVGRTRVWVCEL